MKRIAALLLDTVAQVSHQLSFPRRRESRHFNRPRRRWIPACAGMTGFAWALSLMLFSPAWAASEIAWAPPAGQTVGPPPLDPADPAWVQAPATRVALYPQTTAPGGPGGNILEMEARVLQGDGRLALRLAWPDATADLADPRATDHFADAAAVQFAPAGATLPYVGMGEPGQPVRVWLWRAGRPAEGLSAQGFGSLAKADPAPEAQARRTATGWAVVLRGEAGDAAAVAFAAWDGGEDGRAGRKRLSAWQALVAPDGGWRDEAGATGDPARGARLYAEHGCAACHTPGVGLGPELTHAGGIHWPGYLRRAILEPAAFLVPGYAAIMPPPSLRPDEVEDLVAYLLTLH